MEEILSQIDAALQSDSYYTALFGMLTLPDICSAVDSEDGQTSGAKYKAWFDNYVVPQIALAPPYAPGSPLNHIIMRGKECYFIRCSLLHQGKGQHHDLKFDRIAFYPRESLIRGPGTTITRTDTGQIVFFVGIIDFRDFLFAGVRDWLSKVQATPRYLRNSANVLRLHPEGVVGLIEGMPIIY